MIRWRRGTVTALGRRWRGAVELDVDVAGERVPALAYPALVGEPVPGDLVLLNVTALQLGLGTGGYALVVALPDRLPPDPAVAPGATATTPAGPPPLAPAVRGGPAAPGAAGGPPAGPGDPRAGGHMVKARYTPMQAVVLGVDEDASPHRAALATATDLGGMPVVCADLHSALPAIVAGIRADRPHARICYVMTDGAALPAWFSRTLDGLTDLLAGVVTAGQAFGGDLEATNVHGGLLAARHVLDADVAVVTQGPGNLGTGTPWGFSGVCTGEAVNASAVLHGRPVGALRISGADPRPRHRGVSHHSLTAFGRVALAPADLVVPAGLPDELAALVASALAPLSGRHRIVTVDTTGLCEALRASPVRLATMGRGLDADEPYFLAAAAAGRHAVSLIQSPPPADG